MTTTTICIQNFIAQSFVAVEMAFRFWRITPGFNRHYTVYNQIHSHNNSNREVLVHNMGE